MIFFVDKSIITSLKYLNLVKYKRFNFISVKTNFIFDLLTGNNFVVLFKFNVYAGILFRDTL